MNKFSLPDSMNIQTNETKLVENKAKWVELPDCVGEDWEVPHAYHPLADKFESNVGHANCKTRPAEVDANATASTNATVDGNATADANATATDAEATDPVEEAPEAEAVQLKPDNVHFTFSNI